MLAILKNARTWLMVVSAVYLGVSADAWAINNTTNPPVKTPPPCPLGKCCDPFPRPRHGLHTNSSNSPSCSACGSAQGPQIAGMVRASVSSLDVDIVSGVDPHGELENAQLHLYADQPYMGLFSPEGLQFVHPVVESKILSVRTTGLSSGIAREVVVKGRHEKQFTFQFKTGSCIGDATDRQAAQSVWLKMTDAAGAPVADNPAMYVICYRGTAETLRYSATAPYPCAGYQDEGGRIITNADVGIEVVRDAGKILRQVKSAYSLADVVVPAGCAGKKYEVRFYNPDQVGAKGTDGVYAVSGTPFTVVIIENTSTRPGDVDHLRITRVANGSTSIHDYAYVDAQKMWSLTSGGGLRTEKVSLVTNSATGMKEQVRTAFGPDGKLVSRTATKAQTFAWGEATVEEIKGYGNATSQTQWSYWDNACANDQIIYMFG